MIWRRTIFAAAMYGAATAAAAHFVRVSLGIALAAGFAAAQAAAIALMVAILTARRMVSRYRAKRSRRLAPQIEDALAAHSIGFDQSRRLDYFRRLAPHDVRRRLFALLASSRGERRDRLASLVPDLGLLELRSVQDPLERIRDLIRLGAAERFEQIVTETAHQNRLVRAIVAEELAPHSPAIAQSQIRHALQASDARVVETAQEMLRAWRLS